MACAPIEIVVEGFKQNLCDQLNGLEKHIEI